jgi:hypothetical protein
LIPLLPLKASALAELMTYRAAATMAQFDFGVTIPYEDILAFSVNRTKMGQRFAAAKSSSFL